MEGGAVYSGTTKPSAYGVPDSDSSSEIVDDISNVRLQATHTLPYPIDAVPFHKLPNELLTAIFILCTPFPIKIPSVIRQHHFPWALFNVCKKWRLIVLGMPELWRAVHITYRKPLDPLEWRMIAEKVLEKSGNYPISLDIGTTSNYTIEDRSSFIAPITLHSRRLKSLEIRTSAEILSYFFQREPISLDTLEFLRISSTEAPLEEDINAKVFTNAYSLRTVILDFNIFSHSALHLSWSRIVKLCFNNYELPSGMIYPILNECSNLSSFAISIWSIGEPPIAQTDTTIHPPSLTSLAVDISCCDNVIPFLESLALPSLNKLAIISTPDSRGTWDQALIPIIVGFGQIKSLRIDPSIPPGDVDTLLSKLPLLAEVMLPIESTLPQSTLDMISSRALLPNIKSLGCTITSESIIPHLRMLESRMINRSTHGIIGTLFWLSIESKREFEANPDEIYLLSKLQDDGILKLLPSEERYTHLLHEFL